MKLLIPNTDLRKTTNVTVKYNLTEQIEELFKKTLICWAFYYKLNFIFVTSINYPFRHFEEIMFILRKKTSYVACADNFFD